VSLSNLARQSGVQPDMLGQVESALSYLEYRRCVSTSSGAVRYHCRILQRDRVLRASSEYGDLMEVGQYDVRITVPSYIPHADNPYEILRRDAAVSQALPNNDLAITRLSRELNVEPDEIEEKRSRAYRRLDTMLNFARMDDKSAFIESAFVGTGVSNVPTA